MLIIDDLFTVAAEKNGFAHLTPHKAIGENIVALIDEPGDVFCFGLERNRFLVVLAADAVQRGLQLEDPVIGDQDGGFQPAGVDLFQNMVVHLLGE